MSDEHNQSDPEIIPADVLSPEYTNLQLALSKRIHFHFDETDMPRDFIDEFIPCFTQAIEETLSKFAAGQFKHGGDIRLRDLELDESQEIMDLFCYRIVKRTLKKMISAYVD